MPQNFATRQNDRRLSEVRAGAYTITIENPLPEWARVDVIDGDRVVARVIVAPNGTTETPVPGPGKYDLRVTIVNQLGPKEFEEKRPGAFEVCDHEDVQPKKRGRKETTPEPEPEEVPIRSMADMFRDLKEKEAEVL
jgi:hypothetical protein